MPAHDYTWIYYHRPIQAALELIVPFWLFWVVLVSCLPAEHPTGTMRRVIEVVGLPVWILAAHQAVWSGEARGFMACLTLRLAGSILFLIPDSREWTLRLVHAAALLASAFFFRWQQVDPESLRVWAAHTPAAYSREVTDALVDVKPPPEPFPAPAR